jgi:hypothetical protein
MMFWDSSTGEPQIPKMVKELKWSTNTCIYSYATQGFYGPYDDKVCIYMYMYNYRCNLICIYIYVNLYTCT